MRLADLGVGDWGTILIFAGATGAWLGPWVALCVFGLGLLLEGFDHELGGEADAT